MSALIKDIGAVFYLVAIFASWIAVVWMWAVSDAPYSGARWPFRLAIASMLVATVFSIIGGVVRLVERIA